MTLATKNLYFGLIGVCVLMFVALLAGVYAADKVLARKGGQYALLARMPLDPSLN